MMLEAAIAASNVVSQYGGAFDIVDLRTLMPFDQETVSAAVREANRVVYQKSQAEANCRGMGATVAVVLLWDGQVQIGHVGDCRVYQIKEGRLVQLTKDQTLVNRMVETGKLTEAEAATPGEEEPGS